MKTSNCPVCFAAAVMTAVFLMSAPPVRAGFWEKLFGRISGSSADEVAEAAGRKAVTEALEGTAQQGAGVAAREAAEWATEKALLERAAKAHGDEVLELAGRNPEFARLLAQSADTLMPLVRRHGDDVLVLEARVPGSASVLADVLAPGDLARIAEKASNRQIEALCVIAMRKGAEAARKAGAVVARGGGWIFEKFPLREIGALSLAGLAWYAVTNAPDAALRFLVEGLSGVHGPVVAAVLWVLVALLVWALRRPIGFALRVLRWGIRLVWSALRFVSRPRKRKEPAETAAARQEEARQEEKSPAAGPV